MPNLGWINIDDALGCDFVVDDVLQYFCAGVKRAMRCWIEVKGCSGTWDGACHVTANEKARRDKVASLRDTAAYLIVAVEHVEDPTKVRIAALVDWTKVCMCACVCVCLSCAVLCMRVN